MPERRAHAKINLGLCVGGLRPDGLHEVATVLQRIELADTLSLRSAPRLVVSGFAADTLVTGALEAFAAALGVEPHWQVEIDKRIPVAAGLAGGSSDAAAALLLANEELGGPLGAEELAAIASRLGSDVPFFLEPGPKLASGDGTELEPLELPQDYTVLLLSPRGAVKPSTASVYARFDGAAGFADRRRRLRAAAAAGALADLPGNDLAESPHAARMRELGAFRAEVSGAGPTVYGLFEQPGRARSAAEELRSRGEVCLSAPAW
jgi:4-diphosphocytidyl-2-C-methyl-D-erythritol kinase